MCSQSGDKEVNASASSQKTVRAWLPRFSLCISALSIAVSLSAIVVVLSRTVGVRDPWAPVSALFSLVVAALAAFAVGQWRAQVRTRNVQSAASDVLERAYEDQELFWEISRHVLKVTMNKTLRRLLVESDEVLTQQLEIMLEYTSRVTSAASRLQAALFKASIVCGFKFPVDPNELVPMEGAVVWGWMTSALIRAQTFPESSEARASFVETKLTRVKEALDKAPGPMREKREVLRKTLAPYFEV